MYIKDEIWDEIVSDCIDLCEKVENHPKCIKYPYRLEVLAILYSAIHLEESPIPKKKSLFSKIGKGFLRILKKNARYYSGNIS